MLSQAVGATGHVMGIDVASPDYGAPLTLGTDLFHDAITFPRDAFDAVVVTHGAWCFAEWDLEPQTFAQAPHLVAVWLQALIEGYLPTSSANVRSPFSRKQCHALLAETGWEMTHEFWVDTGALHDGAWEIDLALHDALSTVAGLPVPPAVRSQLRSQGNLLRALASHPEQRSLPAYALTAERFSVSENT